MSSKDKQSQLERYSKGMQHEERRSRLKSANKKMRRNQAPKKARRRNWMPAGLDAAADWDAIDENVWDDYDQQERIMPRDEGERRRVVESTAFRQGLPQVADQAVDDEAPAASGRDTVKGRVVEVSKGLFRVQVADRLLLCSLRGTLNATETGYTNAVAVGDEVLVREDGAGGGMIDTVLPRRTLLARPDVYDSHLQQIIVANVDQLLVVSAWREPHIWLELIDRYLVVAARNNLPVLLCINKIDLMQDAAELDATLRPYRELGYTLVLTSAENGAGIARLRALLEGQTTVLAGLSGVGKSSLISAVEPGMNLRTSHISEKRQEGRHTTTQATWLPLAAGGAVVDTPGIREFGLSGLYQADLIAFMPDLAAHAAGCRFNNCLHLDEPDCAVRAAAETGLVAESRYQSYRKLVQSLPA